MVNKVLLQALPDSSNLLFASQKRQSKHSSTDHNRPTKMLSIIYDQSTSNMTYWTVFAEDKYREACSKSSTLNYKTHRITHFKLSLLSQAIFFIQK